MVLIRETELEIEQQIRFFLEEKLEGILDEARRVKKRRQEVLHGKESKVDFENFPAAKESAEENQPTLWDQKSIQSMRT